jgi:hypothetical protein
VVGVHGFQQKLRGLSRSRVSTARYSRGRAASLLNREYNATSAESRVENVVEEVERRQPAPILEGVFGWGRRFQLYADHLKVEGVTYPLEGLSCIRPIYRTILGISSARLELTFGDSRLILRGIPAVEDVQKLVEYLVRSCPQARLLPARRTPAAGMRARAVKSVRSTAESESLDATAAFPAPAGTSAAADSAFPPTDWQAARRELLRRRKERLEDEQRRRQQLRDGRVGKGRARRDPLPTVQVPLRLAFGEQAYYCCPATLCHEQPQSLASPAGAVRDHGLLILTDRRLIYMGRRCQILLGYDHLLQVSCQRSGVAFLADHWRRRELFTMRRPLECVLCLEKLLWRFQQERRLSTLMRVELEEPFDEDAMAERGGPGGADGAGRVRADAD